MVTATLRIGNTVKHVTLTYDVATCLRDNAARFHDRMHAMGVSMELHFPSGDDSIDNVPDLYQIARDMAVEAVAAAVAAARGAADALEP
jgi:hypothetical protein